MRNLNWCWALPLLYIGSTVAQSPSPRDFQWKHLSTTTGTLPPTNGGTQQTASLIVDVNLDRINDIFIADRTVAPAVIGLFYTPDGWVRYIIEDSLLRIEAGSAAHDIDGDGDPDLVFGGESRSNEIWWWENPFPVFDPHTPWKRHYIKRSEQTKHHDLSFMDFDDDGADELVFWNQNANTLFYAEIPKNPKSIREWIFKPIYQYSGDGEMQPRSTYPAWRRVHEHEGLFPMDINDDGITDIVAGGRWFQYDDGRFIEHIIDASYTFTRCAAGQLIEGGRPEVLLVVGDGVGPLVMYEWQKGQWISTVVIDEVDNGHTLDVVDFDGDGHLDIFNAEMRFGEGNPDAEVRILLGDGKGNFTKTIVATGIGVHEGKIGDLDGDGDADILGKPYTWETPRLDIWLNQAKK